MYLAAGTAKQTPNIKVELVSEREGVITFNSLSSTARAFNFDSENRAFCGAVQLTAKEAQKYRAVGALLIYNDERFFITSAGLVQEVDKSGKYKQIDSEDYPKALRYGSCKNCSKETDTANFTCKFCGEESPFELDFSGSPIKKKENSAKVESHKLPKIRIKPLPIIAAAAVIAVLGGAGFIITTIMSSSRAEVTPEVIAPVSRIISYEVTYAANGGKGGEVKETCKVETLSDEENPLCEFRVLENKFTRSGYNFKGWNHLYKGKTLTYKAGEKVEIQSDIDLLAKWEKQPEKPKKEEPAAPYYPPVIIPEPEPVNPDCPTNDCEIIIVGE